MSLRIPAIVLLSLVVLVILLGCIRVLHDRQIEQLWNELREPVASQLFDPKSVAQLPEPAQRYLRHAIAPGTRLARSVVVEMQGQIGLQPGAQKRPFRASQILAAPGGFIWRASVGEGYVQYSGSDRYVAGEGAMYWFLDYVFPVARASGENVTRSAAGRVALESPLLLPSALLPENGARWEAMDARTVRVYLQVGHELLAPVLTVAADGRLERIDMQRWDAEGPDGKPGFVMWSGDQMTEERSFGGYTIPVRMRATKWAGTAQADAFFEAQIVSAQYK